MNDAKIRSQTALEATEVAGGALAVQEQRAPALRAAEPFDLTPRSLEEAFKLADVLAASELVPKDFRGKPANVLVAVQMGAEVGLKPMQALQSIAVVNGRPSLWGDGLLAIVLADPRCEYVVETMDAAGTAVCQVKRRGQPEQVRTFSVLDAKTARLDTKDGPWQTSPRRMRQLRARAFALRDVFADVLRGMPMAEEVADIPAEVTSPTPVDRIPGTVPTIPKDLLEAAQAAAARGRDAFASWFRDVKNGGSTTEVDRLVLAPRFEEFKATALEADRVAKGELAPAPAPAATAPAGPTFGDDTSGGS